MILNILVVTKYKWSARDQKHDEIKKIFMQKGNGITDVKFTMLYKDVGTPTLYLDTATKKNRIREEWFEQNISREAKLKGFNICVFQFSDEDGRKWGIASGHMGLNFRDGDFFGECWIKCNENSKRKYDRTGRRDVYTVTVPHEVGHELTLQKLTTLQMHDYDFQEKINNIEAFYKALRITIEGEKRSTEGRIIDLKGILQSIKKLFMPNVLYEAALKYVGIDASPNDAADDVVGCADSVSNILNGALKGGFKKHTGTWMLGDELEKDPRFERVYFKCDEILPAGIIGICRTLPNKPFSGHCWITGLNNTMFSNDSRPEYLGKWLMNYTYQRVVEKWVDEGKYILEFYKLK